MAHLERDKKRLTARINRMIGQLEAIKELLEQDPAAAQPERCYEVMRQLSSIRGAHRGLMTAYLEGFVRDHAQEAAAGGTLEEFSDELMDVLRSFTS